MPYCRVCDGACEFGRFGYFHICLRNLLRGCRQVAKAVLSGAKAGSLVLMDEMGSGTDPMQGAALAQSLLEVSNGVLDQRSSGRSGGPVFFEAVLVVVMGAARPRLYFVVQGVLRAERIRPTAAYPRLSFLFPFFPQLLSSILRLPLQCPPTPPPPSAFRYQHSTPLLCRRHSHRRHHRYNSNINAKIENKTASDKITPNPPLPCRPTTLRSQALVDAGSRVALTTHYTQLKELAASDDRFGVSAMQFVDGRPTYRLIKGAVGESFALQASTRGKYDVVTCGEGLGGLWDDERFVGSD